MSTPDWFDRIPKTELHVHLEGAVPIETLWELVKKYGGQAEVADLEALRRKFAYRDFPHFIQTWIWKNGFIRNYDDIAYVGENIARNFVKQNVRYVEAYFSPTNFTRHGLETQKIAEAWRRGLNRISQVEVKLIADFTRDEGSRRAFRTLEEVNEARSMGIIGVGLGGTEVEYPAELFREVYARARLLGFQTTVHAGETVGPSSIWSAVRDLQADRIGHGTRAIEDEELIIYLAEHKIPVETCPISNLRIGAIRTIEQHPIRHYFDRGILVTVNTDDPLMFHNTLAEELRLLETVHRFTRDEIKQVVLNGVESSWLDEDRKRELKLEFLRDPVWSSTT